LRTDFDAWFASQAEAAGALLVPETVVEELLVREGGVVGVRTGREGDLLADVVVVCEGVGLGSRLLERAGLKPPLQADQVAVAFKEVIAMDPAVIESRFNCSPGEGATIECFGEATRGLSGFMFIYTNRETVSVGGGALLSEMADKRLGREDLAARSPNSLLNHFKSHPAVAPLLQGGETVEFSAKMIPEGGARAIPRLFGNGYLVCGDAAMLSNPIHREGSNLAMESGRLAGETVLRARERGDFSASGLRSYKASLDRSWVMSDMRKYDGAVRLLEGNPRLLSSYPRLLDEVLDEFLRVNGESKRQKQKRCWKIVRQGGSWRLFRDMVKTALTLR
jgi:electron transfer flavoprotein-quinone oxidoreductase